MLLLRTYFPREKRRQTESEDGGLGRIKGTSCDRRKIPILNFRRGGGGYGYQVKLWYFTQCWGETRKGKEEKTQ